VPGVNKSFGEAGYFEAVKDHIDQEQVKVFTSTVDLPIEGCSPLADKLTLVAVPSELVRLDVHNAYDSDRSQQEQTIFQVVDACPDALVITNGTFFRAWGRSVSSETRGRAINEYRELDISDDRPPVLFQAFPYSSAGWFGQTWQGTDGTSDVYEWTCGGTSDRNPPCPPARPAPQRGDVRAALGRLWAFEPPSRGWERDRSNDDTLWGYGPMRRPKIGMFKQVFMWTGLAGPPADLLFFLTWRESFPTKSKMLLDDYADLKGLVGQLVESGATIVRGLDAGGSAALAYADPDGSNLAVRMHQYRHVNRKGIGCGGRVNNYVVIRSDV